MKKSLSILAVLCLVALLGACGGRSSQAGANNGPSTSPSTTAAGKNPKCDVPLKATDVGITADTITVQTMADVGSQFAPGLFQGAIDAMKAYATYINAHGGVACRKLVIKTWDSKLDPTESKNGLIEGCKSSFALVGGYAIFNADVTPMVQCPDAQGQPVGEPDVPALAPAAAELCAPTTYTVYPKPKGDAYPCKSGEGEVTIYNGMSNYYVKNFGPGLHGVYIAANATPQVLQGNVPFIEGMKSAGIKFDQVAPISAVAQQSAFTPVVQRMKQDGSNFVYDGSTDALLIKMRKEAQAQGLNSVKLWACSDACYTKAILAAGPVMNGTYVWLPFLPFDEADTNPELKAFIDGVGRDKADAYAAQAWQAAGLFVYAVDKVMAQGGPNALTRSSLLKALAESGDYTANGWLGTSDDQGAILCAVELKVNDGKFERVYPTKPGTLACDRDSTATLNLDVAALASKIQ